MKRRITAIILGAAMVLGIATQALAGGEAVTTSLELVPYGRPDTAAAETGDAALTRVTLAVKGALGIEDEYTEFSGSSYKNGALNFWSLRWGSENTNLNVTANDDGKVLGYNFYDSENDYTVSYSRYSPRLPKNSREDALEAAKAFVDPLLEEDETVVWNEPTGVRSLSTERYNFSGTLYINDVESPITVNVGVRSSDLVVVRFSRTDSNAMLLPDVPSPDADADKDAAAETLKGAYGLELQYVLDSESRQPVLRYVVATQKELLVDAKTGETIDVRALMDSILSRGFSSNGAYYDTAEEAEATLKYESAVMAAPTLSPVEEQAIAKLEGALSIAELEKAARAIDGIGLDGKFALTSSNFSQVSYREDSDEEDNDDVFATLRFVRERRDEENKTIRTSKTVTLNAKTGEFISISGYSSEPVVVEAEAAAKNAEAFAKAHAEHFDEYKLYDEKTFSYFAKDVRNTDVKTTSVSSDGKPDVSGTYFTYFRTVNGVPFKNDSIRVTVDGADGSIVSFSCTYTEDLEFPEVEGIIDVDAALDAYFGAYTVDLAYSQLPVAVSPEDIIPLRAEFANAGYTYVYELRLTYAAKHPNGWIQGVDAKTGEVVLTENTGRDGITYDDVETSYAAAIASELGEYGVGFRGGKLNPAASLTQLDMLALLLSANGYEISDDPTDDDVDYLYQAAEWLGIKFDERDPKAVVTRAEFVRTLVSVTEYGAAAKLENIWAPGFADDSAIAQGDTGYIAIAKALGLVKGDTDGGFHPANAISRQDSLIVLYNFMSR